jgi:hypothetical protein
MRKELFAVGKRSTYDKIRVCREPRIRLTTLVVSPDFAVSLPLDRRQKCILLFA